MLRKGHKLGKYKIDYFITYPAYDLMDDVDLGARASSMMDLITGKSYFGELMPSNNVRPEAPVDGTNVLIGSRAWKSVKHSGD